MEDPQELVGVLHRSNPRIPRRVRNSNSECRYTEADYQPGVRASLRDDNVSDETEARAEQGSSASAKSYVNKAIEKRSAYIAH